MLETDCKIPVDYQPITLPESYPLYGIPLAVKQMRDKKFRKGQIQHKLRIGDDTYRDAIFEIRKRSVLKQWARD